MATILPEDEAAAILTRLFDSLARRMGKRLSAGSREDIRRACALLANAGDELDDLFEDAPPLQPPREERRPAREYTTRPLEVDEWKAEQRRRPDR